MELLVQRRLLADDSEGVNETLNETTGGMVNYPTGFSPRSQPYRNGTGVVVRGRHFLSFGRPHDATGHRSVQEELMNEPIIRLTEQVNLSHAGSDDSTAATTRAVSMRAEALPRAVVVLTVEKLANETTLLRLWHRYGLGEDNKLAKPVNVSLARVLPGAAFRAATLMSLTANQGYNEMRRKRKKWKTTDKNETVSDDLIVSRECANMTVEIRPMEVLTLRMFR